MYHSIGLLPDLNDEVSAHFEGSIPVIRLASASGSQAIHVPAGTAAEQASWLRSLAAKALMLSDDIEERGAEHVAPADAKAAAGLGAS